MKRKQPETNLEAWKDVAGYIGRYSISSFGRIKSLSREVKRKNCFLIIPEMIKKQRLTKAGYLTVYLAIGKKYNHFMVHRLVAIAFIENQQNKPQVNHIDGNKLNNHVSNLEWATSSENLKHAFINGLMSQKGENHASNKLTNKEVLEIFYSRRKIAILSKEYGISTGMIHRIKRKQSWSHITEEL